MYLGKREQQPKNKYTFLVFLIEVPCDSVNVLIVFSWSSECRCVLLSLLSFLLLRFISVNFFPASFSFQTHPKQTNRKKNEVIQTNAEI